MDSTSKIVASGLLILGIVIFLLGQSDCVDDANESYHSKCKINKPPTVKGVVKDTLQPDTIITPIFK